MIRAHSLVYLCVLLCLCIMSLQIDSSLSFSQQWQLSFNIDSAESFADFNYAYAQLPRMLLTLLVGGMLGLVGSLMQQLTQNPLTSPLTLGTSSGAWLALIIVSVWFNDWIADYTAIAAMFGAICAFVLIVAITGVSNMMGLPLVVSGMVVNILLGAIATAIILLNEQYAQNVFMWGAGDLAQNGWDWFDWLWPRLIPALIILLFAPRILTLLRLGNDGAAARGLNTIPAFIFMMVVGIWLVSASITAVGVIGFIGLLTPNIARSLGARTPREELIHSLYLGAALLLVTDMISMSLTSVFGEVIPSGVTTAAIGAPALVWFSRRQMKAQDRMTISIGSYRSQMSKPYLGFFIMAAITGVLLTVCVQLSNEAWYWGVPSEYQWHLRWPRLVTSLFSGIGLAIAGTLLQRLIYNPLASPDILGVSSGATFALVFSSLFLSQSVLGAQWGVALFGSLSVLIVLLLLGKKHQFAPSSLILTGIAITALLEAMVQFCLARGTTDSYEILLWLSGSTYRVTDTQASSLALGVIVLSIISVSLSRWLSLISIGRDFTKGRGLSVNGASLVLLSIVALMCALVTSTMGPVSFVGLVAPHMAMLIGAQKPHQQLFVSCLIGGTLMIWADWIGQVALFPTQIAAGTLVAILGGSYFLILMLVSRIKRS
ncbi:Fe(3+)-hydroxamate ABC transporter permease FhuB [Vibrio sp. 10N.261.51.F12]|uniref:Fe(3+)-hydroxamate ABC transporter permease FhuB n=1 Tax=Vibrio sp. 10N.261.51.F12 TaxID=3229679 RepID=UPI0035504194